MMKRIKKLRSLKKTNILLIMSESPPQLECLGLTGERGGTMQGDLAPNSIIWDQVLYLLQFYRISTPRMSYFNDADEVQKNENNKKLTS